jgi:hypothetical protein
MTVTTAPGAPGTDTAFPNAAPTPARRATEILLWPGGAPGSEGMSAPEILEPPDERFDHYRLRSVHRPSIAAYLAPRETATGAAIVVAPGDGHRWLAIDLAGH